ncbi:TIGR01906 family membrane protein [Clostridium paraputrificum]|uniref:TIGR01906 family membrane protein n=1 Tax=Clostridium paraputrificum TaxID=29363 RepID=UPI003D335F8E
MKFIYKHKIMDRCIQIALPVILALFIILASVKITLAFKPLYYFDIEYLNIVDKSGYNKDEIEENYNYMVDYLLSYSKEYREFKLPTIGFSDEGQAHFEDVKKIFIGVDILLIITGVLGFIGIMMIKRRGQANYLKYTSISLITLPLVIMGFLAVDFDKAFIVFHKVFFRNDNWLFNPMTDPIINILPQDFFMHTAFMVLIIIGLSSIIFMVIYKIILRKSIKTAYEIHNQ